MPVKKPQIPDIPSYRGEDRNLQVWAERIKTAISHLTKTDFVTEKDIHCKSLYVDSDSIYIGGVKLGKPDDSEDGNSLIYNRAEKKISTEPALSSAVTDFGSVFIDGSIRKKTTRITNSDSPYTVTNTDCKIFCDTDGGDITVIIQTAISTDGKELCFYNTGSGTLTIQADQNIDGSSDDFTMGKGTITLTMETTEGWR